MHFRHVAMLLAAVSATGLLMADQAQAQEPARAVGVRDRDRSDYDPTGIRAGAFIVNPGLTLGGRYDDNVFATSENKSDDLIAVVRPTLSVNSDWSQHSLNFGVSSEVGRYKDETDEDYEDYAAFMSSRLDIRRDMALSGRLSFERGHESREDTESARTKDLTKTNRYRSRLTLRKDFNRLNLRLSGNADRRTYDNSAVSQSDRDRNMYGADLRVGYAISPRLDVFVQGRFDTEDYDDTRDRNGFERNTKGYAADVGASVDLTGVLFGEVFAGYRKRTYDDGNFDDEDGVNFGAELTWNATGLTTVTATAERDIEATTQTGSSGKFTTSASLSIDHELLRNLILNANVSALSEDFQDVSRTDETYVAGAGATYLINRNFSIDASYRYSKRNSDIVNNGFTRNIVFLSVTARM